MPAEAVAGGGTGRQSFAARWRAQLPNVAASLTTALALFLASLLFAPVRGFLFAGSAPDYPILCTAEAVQGENGARTIELYVVNRSRHEYSGDELQRTLEQALEGTGLSGGTAIFLPFDGTIGRIAGVREDRAFNDDKGELGIAAVEGGVRVTIQRIGGASILRALIELADMPDVGVTRGSKEANVPFSMSDLYETCYTRG